MKQGAFFVSSLYGSTEHTEYMERFWLKIFLKIFVKIYRLNRFFIGVNEYDSYEMLTFASWKTKVC